MMPKPAVPKPGGGPPVPGKYEYIYVNHVKYFLLSNNI